MLTQREQLSIDGFMDLFLAALVMRGKRDIWIRTNASREERVRMHRLHDYVSEVTEAEIEKTIQDKQYRYFIVRLRNHLAPSPIGSFDDLQHSLMQKTTTIVSIDLSHCHYYQIDLQVVTAKCWLEQGAPRVRELAEAAADKYMAPLERSEVY